MKIKFYLASAIMALSWMGCSQEDAIDELKSGANVIYATIEGASRSTVTDAGKFSWAEGDEIMLFDEDGTNKYTYTYSGTGDGFNPPSSETVNNPSLAYYPANEGHTSTSFYLPSEYGDVNTEYVANTHAAMIAFPSTSGNTYAFMHLGGVMRFNVKNVRAGANEFTFTSLDKKITGSFDVQISNGVRVIQTGTVLQENSVSIKFKPLAEAQDMTFYIPLPVGSYEKYKIEISGITEGGGTFSSVNTTDILTEGANTVSRKSLLLMPTFTFVPDGNGDLQLEKGESKVNVIKLQGSTEATIEDDAEVIVAPGGNADAVATLNYIPASGNNSTLSISDGSAEGTESSVSEGKVVVNTTVNSTIASCEINAPTLTVELSAENDASVTYNEVTALTAQQTLIIGKGITVTTLILNGGNVIIEEGATVATIENAEGFDGKTYIIQKGTLTNSLSSENIIIVSNKSELALRMAAENGGNVTLTEDIVLKEPIVIASGKTVALDLDGKTISQAKACTASYSMITNNGNLTITGNGKISFKDTGNGDSSFGWGSYTISNYGGNLTIENGTIEHLGEQSFATHMICAVFQYSGSSTIKNGTISTPNYRSVRLWHGEMKIEGGTFEGQLWVQTQQGNPATLAIEGGTFGPKGRDGSSVFIGNDNNTVNLSITGGTFETKIGCSNATEEGVAGKVSGGKFTELAKTNTASDLISSDSEFKLNENDNYYYLEIKQSGN